MFVSKRMLIIIGVVVVIVMLALGVGLAYAFTALGQQTTTSTNLSATVTAQTSVASPVVKAQNGQRRVLGVIQSLGAQSFVFATNQGKHKITVNVDAQTKYTNAGKAAAFSNLQVGETVAVQGTVDTTTLTMQAARVMISPKVATPTPKATPTVTATATP